MSAVIHDEYAPASSLGELFRVRTWPLKRLLITAAGCAVMAISGGGLANYLGTPTVTSAGAAPADSAPLN